MTIPPEARAVALILRNEVKKPDKEKLKLIGEPVGEVRHGDFKFCARFQRGFTCPMGLHRDARGLTPWTSAGFGHLATDKEVQAFAEWWDSLSLDEAKRAVDGIWKEEK